MNKDSNKDNNKISNRDSNDNNITLTEEVLSLISHRQLIIGNDLHCYFISFERNLKNVDNLIEEAFNNLQKQAEKMGGKCIKLTDEPIVYGIYKRVQIQFDKNCDETILWEIFDSVSAEELNFFLNVMRDDIDDSSLDDSYYESGDND